jgi:hypothetical protein
MADVCKWAKKLKKQEKGGENEFLRVARGSL